MADVASKQQTTALFLSTIVACKSRQTEVTKTDIPDGKPLLCQRTLSTVFHAVFYTVKLYSLTFSVRHLNLECMGPFIHTFSSTSVRVLQKTRSAPVNETNYARRSCMYVDLHITVCYFCPFLINVCVCPQIVVKTPYLKYH